MKLNAKKKIAILFTLGTIFALTQIINWSPIISPGNNAKTSENTDNIALNYVNLKTSLISGKIHINNNWSAAKIAGIVTGSGTYSDPYVIEDFEIDSADLGNGILIENSTVFS